ncbi:inositol 1,4,5-trisphosphate receptor-interacting protein [Kryptolebias marmoratus]|uniref:Inositol 1,4,5-trisphosphate receptor-interacting protein n=1 Tax=Kryptolebias marmoratus TaxID=37003 RepID=A0A3Q3BGT2_KRYMA|nr:inositol 1,4,5-trisphosphate receptor-interacting protein [Kryptolebias marmoratus]XP_017272408.1 inositol 1,4,5-trisphosphate receptor-interacting protein [Kryptolebias marmoratus]XP_037830712.1 inositol 1,4,5-trisphosphate receptor-interacting protein [Kryptolebias marmoratus]
MMQETVLRVFVVALGLLLCPRDPGVEESDHIIAPDSHNPEERLPREREKLDQATPLSDKMTPDGNEGPHDDINITPEQQSQSDQHSTETIVTKEPRERSDHKLPKKSANESDTNPQEHNSDLKTKQNGKDVLNNSATKEPGNLQERDKKPEQMEERKSPFPHVQTKAAETETAEAALADWERDYLWYIWNTFSIISMMRFFGKYLKRHFQMNQEVTGTFPAGCRVAEVLLPDVATLHYFYDKCVQISSEKKGRDGEFLEGFANDLLDAMRNISDDNGSMVIEDFQVGNASDIIVHVTPPDLYGFQCQLVNNQVSDLLLDMQVCGQIKLVEERIQNGCPCQSEAEDDMVCLLHCESKKIKTKMVDVCDGLCSKNTPFLSKGKVARWFQRTIKQAWAQISHKYEFELNIPYIEAPGALVIRFRSGKMICFNMNPVIKFNAEAHFFITPWSSNNLDIFWTLSLTNYEDHLLEYLSKRLPKNSCHDQTLDIACFLHKRQSVLSGSTALKDYHFKMALMHLLLTKKPSQWNSNLLACRLQDLLEFMEKSLEKKLLTHVLIGNPLAKVIDLPTELTKAKPVNLFHPFFVHNCIYKNAVTHFQEMLRNADMLIHDYVAQHTNNANSSV